MILTVVLSAGRGDVLRLGPLRKEKMNDQPSREEIVDNGVTEEQVSEALSNSDVVFIGVHNCSMCDYPCGYIIDGERVGYDAGCHCSSYGLAQIEERSFADIAEHINMQTGSKDGMHWRERLWRAINGEKVDHTTIRTATPKAVTIAKETVKPMEPPEGFDPELWDELCAAVGNVIIDGLSDVMKVRIGDIVMAALGAIDRKSYEIKKKIQ